MSNTYNYNYNYRNERRRNKKGGNPFGTGIIFVLVGLFFLLKSFSLPIPAWVISWQTLLITIGLIVWVKSEFKNVGGFIMMMVGGVFLAREIYGWPWDMSKVTWPIVLIIVGVCLMFRPRHKKCGTPTVPDGDDDTTRKAEYQEIPATGDYVNTSVIFSGETKNIVSKNFQGGAITAIFGGADINLLQSDINGEVFIDVSCVFGGVDLIVPANWNVRILVHTVFAGVEDKRPVELLTNNGDKTLVLTGTCTFGGIEVKSYS